ncbi:MAG: PQQ-binding-like beta-propeller repeat protein [Planctomycetota bacterium]|nr:PQQ-binding-like beta-propeller repeat protein [Planctomycetota bacterium]
MSAQIFIDKLEASNLLDAEVIGKLRKKIAKPGKIPPAKAVATYCLEKGFLTKVQAEKLLQSVSQEVEQLKNAASAPLDFAAEEKPAAVEEPAEEQIIDLSTNASITEPLDGLEELADPFDPVANATNAADPYGGSLQEAAPTEAQAGAENPQFEGKRFHEQSFDSRWIILGSASLVILLLAGWFFATVIMKGSSDETFREAEELFASQSYAASVESYKNFIKNFETHAKVPFAHVKFRVAEMKVAASGKDVKNTVSVFQENIEKITLVMADQINDPSFKDEIRKMIALDTVTAAQKAANAAANKTTVQEKEAELEKAQDMMRLVNDGKFVPRSERELPSFSSMIEVTEATLNTINNSIVQEKETVKSVARIQGQINAGQTYAAYQTYDELVTKYPSAGDDQRVVGIVIDISKKERSLVTRLNPEIEKFENVADSTSPAIVNRVSIPTHTGSPVSTLDGRVDAFLVDGCVYGIDIGKGKIIWRHFVGYETTINPIWLKDPERILISDQKDHRLRLIEPTTGNTIWHKSIGEPFLKPTVSGNKIFLTISSGKLARVDSETGDVTSVVKLPQRLMVPVTTNAAGNVLYQAGEHLNLYVLSVSLTDMKCVQAFYTGHRDGSIRVSPLVFQGVLVVPVNIDSNTCELRLLVREQDSLELKVAGETAELKGIIVKDPKVYGNYLTTLTINGTVNVFELDSDDETCSLANIASKAINLPTNQEIFYTASNGKIWIGTKGIVQYAVVIAKQKIQDQSVADNADFFVGEMAVYEGLLVHLRKRAGSRMTSITGVNPETLNEIWRLDIGGGLAGAPLVSNDSVIAINSQGDFFQMDEKTIAAGISHEPIHRASKTQQNLVFTRSVGFADGSGFIIGPQDRKDSISFIPANKSLPVSLSEINTKDLKVTSDPIEFMDGVLIGLNNGEIRHVIPRGTGADATFVPQAKVEDEFSWQRPCPITSDTFVAANRDGRIYLIKYMPNDGKPYLAQVLDSKVEKNIIGPLVTNGSLLFTLGDGTTGNDLLVIDPANLKIKGNYALGGIATWGPESTGNIALATKEDGTLLGFSGDTISPSWEVKLPHGRATGRPLAWKGKIVITLKDGKIALVDPTTASAKIIETHEPIAGNSTLSGDLLHISGNDGSICVIDLAKVE